ncbi:MAG: protein kinase [Ardenticatenaceae bacterium]|nr:protein kinase [Ardenticatenaceae bacterium]MCB8987206.1 protein kinase [Ardenticatenaceae bacterium]
MSFKQIGRYEIIREIGRGGMATVYLGHDLSFQRDVAIKLLPPQFSHDPTFHERFNQEAHTLAQLEHNAVVPVYDYGEEGDWPYLVMRYMAGGSLADRLKSGPLSLEKATNVTQRMGAALDKAHKLKFIHRDLKPGNVLFDEEDYAYLADFGIVRLAESTHTVTMIGTPDYMTPEQIRGLDIDCRSDIYQLGILLFEMLAGQKPFVANDTAALMYKHAHDPVPDVREWNKELPDGCAVVIRRAMAKDPADRYDSAGEMAAALTQYLTRTQSPTVRLEATKRPRPERETAVSPHTPQGPHVVSASLEHAYSRPKREKRPSSPAAAELPAKRPATPWIRWIFATVAGFVLGFVALFPLYGGWSSSNLVNGAIFGLVASFFQWLVLRRRINRAFTWMLTNMAVFAIFFVVTDVASSDMPVLFLLFAVVLIMMGMGIRQMRRSSMQL